MFLLATSAVAVFGLGIATVASVASSKASRALDSSHMLGTSIWIIGGTSMLSSIGMILAII